MNTVRRGFKLVGLSVILATFAAVVSASYQAPGDPPAKTTAAITVLVPADAEVFFDGTPTLQKGPERLYYTPALETGKTYSYSLRAKWTEGGKPVDQTRKVQVGAGSQVRVDFLVPGSDTQEKIADKSGPATKPVDKGEEIKKPSGKDGSIAALGEQELREIAVETYIFGYPLITSEVTRRQMTNVEEVDGLHGPMGHILNVKKYPPVDYRGVTAPNADTLYSVAWVDVGTEPWVFSHPDMGKRFYLFPIYSLWTPVIESPGARTAGGAAAHHAITGPSWSGKLPEGVKEIKSPTRYAFMIGRTYCSGTPEDYQAVNNLQDQFKLVPLSSFGKAYKPPEAKMDPDPGFSMTDTVREVINDMDAQTYFAMLARLMKDNPPSAEDAPLIAKIAKIGLVPGQPFEMAKLDMAVQKALKDVGKMAFGRINERQRKAGTNQNGWIVPAAAGRYGTDYLNRAVIAAFGWGANLPEDAVYPSASVDGDGKKLSGANKYVVHFDKGQTPPANGFWSITMYDPEYFFVPNPLNRYTVSPRDSLKYNDDGSLDLYFQNESPGKDKETNWLPAPKGDFILMMRIYWPKDTPPSVLPPGKGTWTPPAVKMVAK